MQRSRARYSTDMRQSWDNLQQHADKHKTACQYNGSPRTVCGSRSVAHHHGAVSAAVIESTCIHMRKRRAGQSEGHGATSLRPRWAFPVGITRRASSRACGAVRGGRRPPGSSRWGGWVREGQGEGEVLRRAEEALCGRVGVWACGWACGRACGRAARLEQVAMLHLRPEELRQSLVRRHARWRRRQVGVTGQPDHPVRGHRGPRQRRPCPRVWPDDAH